MARGLFCCIKEHAFQPGLLVGAAIEWQKGLSWDRLSRLGAVCVGILPALCAILVPLCAHGNQSIAMTTHPSDPVFEDTEC